MNLCFFAARDFLVFSGVGIYRSVVINVFCYLQKQISNTRSSIIIGEVVLFGRQY